MDSVTDLVQCGLELSVEPDMWFWYALQAVGTRRVPCVFLERPFTFGSSGLQCSEAIPDGFAALVCFVLALSRASLRFNKTTDFYPTSLLINSAVTCNFIISFEIIIVKYGERKYKCGH